MKINLSDLIRELIDEMSTTGDIAGYDTPRAFSDDDDEENAGTEAVERLGYKLVKKKKKGYSGIAPSTTVGMSESKYSEYKNDESLTPKQKIGNAMKEVKNMIAEMEKVINRNIRLKTEMGVKSGEYWKKTHKDLHKISERLIVMSNRLKKLSE